MIKLKKVSKLILYAAFIFIVYGYLCRIIGIYFFWESRPIGLLLIPIGIFGILSYELLKSNTNRINKTAVKIGLVFIGFILIIGTTLYTLIEYSDEYEIAQSKLRQNSEIIDEIGKINGFSRLISGSIKSKENKNTATFNIIVKGENKYMDVMTYMRKNYEESDWEFFIIDKNMLFTYSIDD